MNKFFSLTKALLKSGGSPFQTKSKKKSTGILLTIFIILCFMPMIVTTTFSFIASYDTLVANNMQGMLLTSMLSASCIAMIIFGIFYVISVYYYSGDTENLLALPLKPSQILASKFVLVVIYEYFIEFFVTFPVIIAYGIKMHSIMFWIYSVIIFITLPIIPIVICSIISMIVMSFTKVIKNKDAFKMISGLLVIGLALGINFVMQGVGKKTEGSKGIASVFINNKSKINAAANVFPTSRIPSWSLIESNSTKGFLYLIMFLALSILLFYIFILLGQKLYFKGVIGINESSGSAKKLSGEQLKRLSLKQSKLQAYIRKELKLLVRTPAYFLNCVTSGIIFPPLFAFFIFWSQRKELLKLTKYGSTFIIAASGIIALLCCMASVTSTSISREGRNLFVCKYIPVEYSTQIWAKIISGVIISTTGVILTVIAAGFMLKLKISAMIMIFAISFLGVLLDSFIGICLDTLMPKLSWDNETVAVKNNMNVMLNMIAGIVLLGAVTIGASILAASLKIGVYVAFIMVVAAYCILDIIMYCIVSSVAVKAFSKIEN